MSLTTKQSLKSTWTIWILFINVYDLHVPKVIVRIGSPSLISNDMGISQEREKLETNVTKTTQYKWVQMFTVKWNNQSLCIENVHNLLKKLIQVQFGGFRIQNTQ